MTDLKYFKPNEFKMGDVNVFKNMDIFFLEKLDTLRNNAGLPIVITSSYRNPWYNEKVGGVKNSYHLQGRAVDFKVNNSKDRAIFIKEALNLGLSVGVMRNALHVDDREDQVLFHYYN